MSFYILNIQYYMLYIQFYMGSTDIYILISHVDLKENCLRVWNAILEKHLLLNLSFSLVFGETPLPKRVYRPWEQFPVFCQKMMNHGKSQVESWFGFVSLILIFSLYFNNLSWITFPPPTLPPLPPSTPRAPLRRRWHS